MKGCSIVVFPERVNYSIENWIFSVGELLSGVSMEGKAWHTLSGEETLLALGSDWHGLGHNEVRRRLDRYGPNILEEEAQTTPVKIFLEQSLICRNEKIFQMRFRNNLLLSCIQNKKPIYCACLSSGGAGFPSPRPR